MYKRFNLLVFALIIAMSACQPRTAPTPTAGPATASPVVSAPSPTQAPAATALASATGVPAMAWMQYRDARYGYGIALPCYWSINPTPEGGTFAAMTARSYSDEFFQANSARGEWISGVFPEGAYKLDVIVVEGIDPSLNLEEAVRYFHATYVHEQELLSVEETTFGRHQGAIATAQGGLQGGTKTRTVYFLLDGGKLLLFSLLPDAALDAADIQSVLGSFAASPDEPVILPAEAPSGPAQGDPVSCT